MFNTLKMHSRRRRAQELGDHYKSGKLPNFAANNTGLWTALRAYIPFKLQSYVGNDGQQKRRGSWGKQDQQITSGRMLQIVWTSNKPKGWFEQARAWKGNRLGSQENEQEKMAGKMEKKGKKGKIPPIKMVATTIEPGFSSIYRWIVLQTKGGTRWPEQ